MFKCLCGADLTMETAIPMLGLRVLVCRECALNARLGEGSLPKTDGGVSWSKAIEVEFDKRRSLSYMVDAN